MRVFTASPEAPGGPSASIVFTVWEGRDRKHADSDQFEHFGQKELEKSRGGLREADFNKFPKEVLEPRKRWPSSPYVSLERICSPVPAFGAHLCTVEPASSARSLSVRLTEAWMSVSASLLPVTGEDD